MKLCYLDFEFNSVSEPQLRLVSLALRCTENAVLKYARNFWLWDDVEAAAARAFIRKLFAEKYTFVSYSMEAEARSLLTLFGDDKSWLKSFQAVDLYLEYRCLLNHWNHYQYGYQYIRGGVKVTKKPPPKWARRDNDDEDYDKPPTNLAAACYKLLGEKIDTEEKETVRDLIIRGEPNEIRAERARIQKYNESDVENLPYLLSRFYQIYTGHDFGPKSFLKSAKGFTFDRWMSAALARGNYAVRTARMVELGYPVNVEKIEKFKGNVREILKSAAEDVIDAGPEILPFRWDKRGGRYIANEKNIREWVKDQNHPYWRKTKTKQFSISKEAFGDWYDSNSEGFPGAYCRYAKTKQSLNGFLPGGKKSFSEFLGKDARVRPYFGIYGSQSSRSQPGAVGFIPLKAHWMRNFIEAAPGRALVSVDYASQEFLIAAVLSQDMRMMKAYQSGDVYLAFGKDAKILPPEATKASHALEREVLKAMVLGISYDMSAKGLAPRITKILKKEFSEDKAENLISTFYDTYPDYALWKKQVVEDYHTFGHLTLSDGWVMWGDNDNNRSVGNCPVQGHGAVIMRKAVGLAQENGLDVVYTLHDALTVEYPSAQLVYIEKLRQCMQAAFKLVMEKFGTTVPIRLEAEAWSVDYKDLPVMDGVKFMEEYTDKKGQLDLVRYRQYFS
jgi:hypothetical protein